MMRHGAPIVRPFDGSKSRTAGELVDSGGLGLVVLGRAPLIGEVAFNERDTGRRYPLAPGMVISRPFDRWWLFHPYAEGGEFLFAVLTAESWIESNEPPEKLRFGAYQRGAGNVGATYGVQIRNLTRTDTSYPTSQRTFSRLARVTTVRFSAVAGAMRYGLVVTTDPSAFTAAKTGGTLLEPRDARVPRAFINFDPNSQDGGSSSAMEWGTNLGQLPPNGYIAEVSFDASKHPDLTIPLDVALSPGAALQVYQLDNTSAPTVAIGFEVTEEKF